MLEVLVRMPVLAWITVVVRMSISMIVDVCPRARLVGSMRPNPGSSSCGFAETVLKLRDGLCHLFVRSKPGVWENDSNGSSGSGRLSINGIPACPHRTQRALAPEIRGPRFCIRASGSERRYAYTAA